MADLDSLIDSMIQERDIPEASLDPKYDKTFELKQTPGKGQGLFARQFFSVSDPICALSYPTMVAIDSESLPTTCYHCLVVTASPLPIPSCGHASVELKTCNGCHVARFCTRDCQVKSWSKNHKYECKIFKKLKDNLPPAFLRAVLRLVLLKDRELLPRDEWNRIISLDAHEQSHAARGRSNLNDMAQGIKHLAQSSMGTEMIERLIFIMKSNAIELPTPIYGGIGVMLDPLVGRINHSCEPNVSIHRPQHTMSSGWMDSTQLSDEERKTFARLIPLRDIQEGEELLLCYVVPTTSVKFRNATLMQDYFFECNCPKCFSDTEAASALLDKQPDLSLQYGQWAEDTMRQVSRISHNASAFQKATAAMDKSELFLEHPTLYTTGEFNAMALRLLSEALKAQAMDEALINVLRVYFLVNPERFVGRHNATNIYTIFLMLDILDLVAGVSMQSWSTDDKREKWLNSFSDRGLSKSGLVYWRRRLCADVRKRLEGSAAKDILALVEKRELAGQLQRLSVEDQDVTVEDLEKGSEQEMRTALRLKEPRWRMVLQNTGC